MVRKRHTTDGTDPTDGRENRLRFPIRVIGVIRGVFIRKRRTTDGTNPTDGRENRLRFPIRVIGVIRGVFWL